MTFLEILLNVGSFAAVMTAILLIVWKLTFTKITSNWEQRSQAQNEILKAQLTKSSQLFDSVLGNFNQGHQHAQDKRVEAIEKLWESVLEKNTFSTNIATLYRVLSNDQMRTFYKNPLTKKDFIKLDELSMIKFIKQTYKSEIKIDLMRPFISTELWQLYKVHSAFITQSIKLFTEKKSQKISTIWVDDKAIIKALRTVFTEQELKFSINLELGSFNNVVTLIESKILKECQNVLSGKLAVDASIENARRLLSVKDFETTNEEI